MRTRTGPFTNSHTGRLGFSRYHSLSGGQPMRAYIVEISAKVIVRSSADPDDLPADIYSQISEFIHSEDDLLDLEISAAVLPADLSGAASH